MRFTTILRCIAVRSRLLDSTYFSILFLSWACGGKRLQAVLLWDADVSRSSTRCWASIWGRYAIQKFFDCRQFCRRRGGSSKRACQTTRRWRKIIYSSSQQIFLYEFHVIHYSFLKCFELSCQILSNLQILCPLATSQGIRVVRAPGK